jgi:hypothetical protein
MDTPVADVTPTPSATPEASGAPAFEPAEWMKGLTVEPEILQASHFKNFKSLDDVVKSYHHAQKMIGADKVVIPNKNSSPDEWKNYYAKVGHPTSLEEFKVELPKTLDDQEFKSNLMNKALELNMRPDQLSSVVDMMEKYYDSEAQKYEQQEQAKIQQGSESLLKEWGEAGFKKNIAGAQRVIKHFGGDEALKQVLESPLANDVSFIKLMAKIGEKLTSEDSFTLEVTSRFGMTKDEASRKINEVYGKGDHPYFNPQHAQHKEAMNDMLKWQEILAGN